MRNDGWQGKVLKVIFWILLTITIISGYLLLTEFIRLYQQEKIWEEVKNLKDAGYVSEKEMEPGNILSKYCDLYERNSDVVGWLEMEGAGIDSPVMQTKEQPEYYLRRNFDGKNDNGGTPFIDSRCSVFPRRSFNLIVYGHYSELDYLFHGLLNYSYEPWALDHREFQFDTLREEGTYEVVAAFFYDCGDAVLNIPEANQGEQAYTFYNYIELNSKEGFEQFVNGIAELNLYQTSIELSPKDKLLTIVCCTPKVFSEIMEEGRFVVVAKQRE